MKFLAITLTALLSQVAMAQFDSLGLDRVERVQITCSSQQNQPESCYVGGDIMDVRLIRQVSKSPCREGRTFWADDLYLHVTEGCRGVFEVLVREDGGHGGGNHGGGGHGGGGHGGGNHGGGGHGGGHHDNDEDETVVSCSSWEQQYNTCYVGRRVRAVELVRQESNNSCIEGYSYGVSGDSIWVDRGCRGLFRVFSR
ncbi:MAG: DUF3011 domain-containing protein [Pseudobdellovibrionaceae bacterium]